MIRFLDFDGVLHPEYDGEPTPADRVFCHLPRFEAIMRDFPMAEIVISSIWRYQFSLENLRARFSPDIAARIIDATPQTERIEGEYLPARREGEILDWPPDAKTHRGLPSTMLNGSSSGTATNLWPVPGMSVWMMQRKRSYRPRWLQTRNCHANFSRHRI